MLQLSRVHYSTTLNPNPPKTPRIPETLSDTTAKGYLLYYYYTSSGSKNSPQPRNRLEEAVLGSDYSEFRV